jgi:hypothetical protein
MQKTFKARIRLETGAMPEVSVQASNWALATEMLEAQYGKGSVLGVSELQGMESASSQSSSSSGDISDFKVLLSLMIGGGVFYLMNKFGVPIEWTAPISIAAWVGSIVKLA